MSDCSFQRPSFLQGVKEEFNGDPCLHEVKLFTCRDPPRGVVPRTQSQTDGLERKEGQKETGYRRRKF